MKYSVFDAHCDTLDFLCDEGKSLRENDLHIDMKRMGKYKSYTQVFACWTEPSLESCALERCIRLADAFYESGAEGILSIEGAGMITSLAILRMLHRLGVKIIALTWNFKNHLAAGALENGGVTEFGKRVIEEMNRLKIFLDVSHLNEESFYDAARYTRLPILATHSNSAAICPNPRNLSDDMFKTVMKSGGVVGINLYPPFLNESGSADIDDIVRHIDYFMSLGGESNIGIGADFDGVNGLLPKGIEGCQDLYKIFDRLLQENYTEEQVEKISHLNFERLLKNTVSCGGEGEGNA